MEDKAILIPYMVVSVNPCKFDYSTSVTPGSFTVPIKDNHEEDMAKFFYEETAKFMVENSTSCFKTIREYCERFCGKLNTKLMPFTIYFFYNKEWNVFLYSEEDLMALYHIRFREFYYSDSYNEEAIEDDQTSSTINYLETETEEEDEDEEDEEKEEEEIEE